MNISGIYMIQSVSKPDRIYVGSSGNIPERFRSHKRALRRGCHDSSQLQNHYNKYGKDDLVFEVIENTDFVDCVHKYAREQTWMNRFSYCGTNKPYFNVVPVAGSTLGRRSSEGGKPKSGKIRVFTEEAKRSVSAGLMGHWGWSRGKTWKWKDTGNAKKTPIYQFSLSGVFIKEWISFSYANKKLGVCISSMLQCCKKEGQSAGGFTWRYKSDVGFPRDLTEGELRKKGSKAKSVIQCNKDGGFVAEWGSVVSASSELLIHRSAIICCCRGKNKTAGGFIWKYKSVA